MRSPDNKGDIPPPKKAKLEETTPNPQDVSAAKKAKRGDIIPNPQDAAKKAKLEELIPNPQDAANKAKLEEITPNPQDGTNIEYHEHPELREYLVLMKLEDLRAHRKSGEDVLSFYQKVMRDAGCPESKIKPLYTSWNFYAYLSPDEAKRLADLDTVQTVAPYINCRVYHELNQPR